MIILVIILIIVNKVSGSKMKGFWGNTIKYLVFLTNLLVFLVGCVVLGFGIYLLVDDNGITELLEKGSYSYQLFTSKTPQTVLVIASAIVVLVSFFGCCGALKENRCLVFVYFFIVLIVMLATVVGTTLAATKSLDELKDPLMQSLQRYDPEGSTEDAIKIANAWDSVQMEFSCCGVYSFKDWSNGTNTPYPNELGHKVPVSCCSGLGEPELERDCLVRPYIVLYENRVRGCFAEFSNSLHDNEHILGIVTLSINAVMIVNLLTVFTFALCMSPKKDYEAV